MKKLLLALVLVACNVQATRINIHLVVSKTSGGPAYEQALTQDMVVQQDRSFTFSVNEKGGEISTILVKGTVTNFTQTGYTLNASIYIDGREVLRPSMFLPWRTEEVVVERVGEWLIQFSAISSTT